MAAMSEEMFVSFEQARNAGAFRLADMWADAARRPVRVPADVAAAHNIAVRTVAHEIDELAVMAALASWLQGWMPIYMHHALLAGASIEEVSTATGLTFGQVCSRWRDWSQGQLQVSTDLGLPCNPVEHDRVRALIERATRDQAGLSPAGNLRLDPAGGAADE